MFQGSNTGKDKNSTIDWSPYAFVAFLSGAAYFVVSRLGSIWAHSIDLALHCVLVARLMTGEHIADVDPTMGEMTHYPRISHTIAAVVGALGDSPILGLHITSLVSLIALWGLIAWAMTGSGKLSSALLVIFLILMLLNGLFFHVEIFGNEIIGNYFFPQLVSQALAVLVLVLAGRFEKSGVPAEIRYVFLALSVPALASVHLIPALEVAGVLTLSIISECYASWRLRQAAAGVFALLLDALLTAKNADFWMMVTLSEINGAIYIRYIRGAGGVVVLAIGTFIISAAILYRWTQSDPARRTDRLFMKYLACFGVACAGLCIAQYLMLSLFGKGSEYAGKKYGFGLDTTLFLMAVYAVAIALPKSVVERLDRRLVPLACVAAVPLLFVVSPQFKIRHAIDADRLVNVERLLRHYRDVALEPRANTSDYAVGISGVDGIGNYLLSIVSLHAPRLPNAITIISGEPLPKPDQVGFIFTSENSRPWDVPTCRRHIFPNSIVQLDGSCVVAARAPPVQ